MNYLSKNIKHLRSQTDLNQEDFGKLFGCTRDNIASYERGTEPKIHTLQNIVNHFHITIDQIYSTDLSNKDFKENDKVNDKINDKISPNISNQTSYKTMKKDLNESASTNKNGGCSECESKERLIVKMEETIKALQMANKAQEMALSGLHDALGHVSSKPDNQKRRAG